LLPQKEPGKVKVFLSGPLPGDGIGEIFDEGRVVIDMNRRSDEESHTLTFLCVLEM
jgi:hypothetical protein